MVTDDRLPVVCLDGVPELSGADWRGHAFVPGTWSSVRGAIGTTLSFYTVRCPEIASNEQARAKYQLCDHDYRDVELLVNGRPYPAVEAVDRDLHVRVCAAKVKGFTLIAVVPADREIPGVKAVWPPEDTRDIVQAIGAFVQLSRGDGESLKGACPFHEDRLSLFTVSPGKEIWHCFGCGSGGDVDTFLTRIKAEP